MAGEGNGVGQGRMAAGQVVEHARYASEPASLIMGSGFDGTIMYGARRPSLGQCVHIWASQRLSGTHRT